MSEAMAWSLGLLLAMFGPLLLLPVIWAVYRWPLRYWLGDWTHRRFGAHAQAARLVIATVLIGIIVFATYLPGRLEFAELCGRYAKPVIVDVVEVPGFYSTSLYPYEAEGLLREWGFSYVEAPDMYKKARTLNYTLGADGKTVVAEIPSPTSRFAASHTTRAIGNTLTLSEKRVFELATDRELARAGSVVYHGGPLGMILGVHGMSNCPNPRYAEGSRQFDDYYYLERKVLKSRSAPYPPARLRQ